MKIKVVISDWDETITAKDTLGLVGQTAYHVKPGFEPSWQYFVDQYMNDYSEFVGSRSKQPRKTIEEEKQYLSDLKEVELRSVARVETSNLFQGVPLYAVRAQAKSVDIRPGFWETLGDLRAQGIVFIVVSVNWSQAFIEQVFIDHGYKRGDIKIYANEIETDDRGVATGLLGGGYCLRTANDKLKVVKTIKRKYIDACDGGGTSDGTGIAYLGDSSTDLLAILEADVGVVVAKEKLLEDFERLGVTGVNYIKEWSELTELLNV